MADEEKLNAKFEYKGEGELLSDISSSEPLKKKKVVKSKKTSTKIKKSVVKKTTIKKSVVKKPSVKKVVKKKPIKKIVKEENLETKMVDSMSNNKIMYNNMALEGSFILKYNGVIIYDSESNKSVLDFQDKYFTLNGRIFNYDGLNFKFKK